MILTAIILFHIVLALDLWSDYKDWKEGRVIEHAKQVKERIVLLTPPVILLSIPVPGAFIWGLALSGALVGFTYWTVFDGLFNVIRKFKWAFTGSVDKDEAKLDILQRKYKWIWVAKIIISLGLKITYIILL